MIATPADVQAAAQKKWPTVAKHLVGGTMEDVFPMELKVSLKPKTKGSAILQPFAEATQSLIAHSKATASHGYTVHVQPRRSRDLGKQNFPDRITVDSLDDYAAVTGRRKAIDQTITVGNLVRESFAQLQDWLNDHSSRLHEWHDRIESMIEVTKALVANPNPDCFLRQLNVPVDTKFIQKNERTLISWLDRLLPVTAMDVNETKFARRYGLRDGLPHHAIRFLDPTLMRTAEFPCDELSLPMRTLRDLPIPACRVLVVENRTNLLSVPGIDNTIALGGVGDAVTRLADIGWLPACELFYWGDIDVDGFRILANWRRLFPTVRSVLMDNATLAAHADRCVSGNGQSLSRQPTLTDEENLLLQHLGQQNIRLEQERINDERVKRFFDTANGF